MSGYSLYCHNFNTGPFNPALPIVPAECKPYACNAVEQMIKDEMWDGWPLFDPTYDTNHDDALTDINNFALPLFTSLGGVWAGPFDETSIAPYAYDPCVGLTKILFRQHGSSSFATYLSHATSTPTAIRQFYQDPDVLVGIKYTLAFTSFGFSNGGVLDYSTFNYEYDRTIGGISNRVLSSVVSVDTAGVNVEGGVVPFPVGFVVNDPHQWVVKVRLWLEGNTYKRYTRVWLDGVLFIDYSVDTVYSQMIPGTERWAQTASGFTGDKQYLRNWTGAGVNLQIGPFDVNEQSPWIAYQRNQIGYAPPVSCFI